MSLTAEEQAKIGGSDVAAVLGLSQWSTPFEVYVRIVSALEGRPLKGRMNQQQARGNIMERAVLEVYANRTGAKLLPGPKLAHPRLAFMRASLDALAERDGVIVADAKTIGASERHHFGEEGTDQVRQDILFQMTLYIGIGTLTGHVTRPAADVPVLGLSGADPVVYHVGFDAELFAMLEAASERFWVDHVLPRRPPPLTEPLKDVDAAGRLYPRHEGEARQWDSLGTAEQVAIREWLQARKEQQKAKALVAEHEARLKLLLGTVPRVEGLPPDTGAKSITWRQNKPGKVTNWEMLAKVLGTTFNVRGEDYERMVREHTTTKDGARPLTVQERKEEGCRTASQDP